jgi:rhodanese-related sulfurtransferase
MGIPTISVHELYEMQKSGRRVELIDVRTPAEFHAVHCEGARLIPLDRLEVRAVLDKRIHPGEPLYLVCRSGNRARQACEQFLAAGFADVVCLEGGTLAWEQAGLPVKRGRKALPLDRQVRIAVGLLLLLTTVLGLLVHPLFVVMAGLIGAGLLHAGLTDQCAMAMMLARMPWNQRREPGGSCCPS